MRSEMTTAPREQIKWVIGFGLAVLIIAVAALFPVFFDLGSKVRDMLDHAVQSHAVKTP